MWDLLFTAKRSKRWNCLKVVVFCSVQYRIYISQQPVYVSRVHQSLILIKTLATSSRVTKVNTVCNWFYCLQSEKHEMGAESHWLLDILLQQNNVLQILVHKSWWYYWCQESCRDVRTIFSLCPTLSVYQLSTNNYPRNTNTTLIHCLPASQFHPSPLCWPYRDRLEAKLLLAWLTWPNKRNESSQCPTW